MRPTKYRYQALFFTGLALIIVLLPFPNIFGIVLDAAVLALAYPVIGWRLSLFLVFVYNFNPLKLNGAMTVYYFLFAIIETRFRGLPPLNNHVLAGAITGALMLLVTFAEFLVIRNASGRIWKVLSHHDPRMGRLVSSADS